jgi:hypothetical protein
MAGSAVLIMWAFLLLGLGFVIGVIAADKNRFLARIDLTQWREAYYLRSLPNFLGALYDNHFPSAWPVKCNALSAAFFRFRARPLLRQKTAELRQDFLRQHTVLFALRESLHPFLQDFILNEQEHIVGSRVANMEDTIDRDRLVAFLHNVKDYRRHFHETLTLDERQILLAMIERQFIPTLRAAHAIFQEHGYSLLPEFTQLRRWQEMSGTVLVQELPVLPPVPAPTTPSAIGPSHSAQVGLR